MTLQGGEKNTRDSRMVMDDVERIAADELVDAVQEQVLSGLLIFRTEGARPIARGKRHHFERPARTLLAKDGDLVAAAMQLAREVVGDMLSPAVAVRRHRVPRAHDHRDPQGTHIPTTPGGSVTPLDGSVPYQVHPWWSTADYLD